MPTCVTAENLVDVLGENPLHPTVKAAATGASPVQRHNKHVLASPHIVPHRDVGAGCEEEEGVSCSAQERTESPEPESISAPLLVALFSRMAFSIVLFLCQVNALLYRLLSRKKERNGYAPITKDLHDVWRCRLLHRFRHIVSHPIDSRPSRVIDVMERVANHPNETLPVTGKILPCVNLASYNYLGFADDVPSITRRVLETIDQCGLASCSAPQHAGQHCCVAELERAIANFLGKDDAIVCGMGFGTNFRGLPALFGSDTLVISDSLNHSSLVNGVRISGARVKVFRHSDMKELEKVIREAVVLGRNAGGAYVPWTRIVIIVEGIYSMEGEIIDLAHVVALKKKYGALLFVDEAHSIGAIGKTGRGVTEHCGVDPRDVDILMGTFTKSFGSIGGYLACEQSVIDYLRTHSSIALHCDALAPPCAQQVLAALDVILGRDGTDLGRKRIHQLKENSRFFRQGLISRGFVVLGDDSSPVVPVMIYSMSKLLALARVSLLCGLAIVPVEYPATPLYQGRLRFCISAAHTRADLQFVLDLMVDMSRDIYIQYRPSKMLQG